MAAALATAGAATVVSTPAGQKVFFTKNLSTKVCLSQLGVRRDSAFCQTTASYATVDVDVGHISDFEKGELRAVKVQNGKRELLVANINGTLYCASNSCSHYSAPLHTGSASSAPSVYCPWHAAEFCLRTGKPLQGPGLNSIAVYPIKVVEGTGRVIATVPEDDEYPSRVPAPMARRDPKNPETIGIVGGGAAALAAAETLRQEGYTGRIVILTDETHPPYDRPVLSKNLNAKVAKIELRSPEFLRDEADVELLLNTKASSVDVKTRTIKTEKGETFTCNKILIATGGSPNRPPIPGAQLKNVEVLRSPEDAERIAQFAALDRYVVVVGSSFIGVEVAACLARGGAKVTMVGKDKVPLGRLLGEQIGRRIMHLLNTKKVVCRNESEVVRFIGQNGAVTGVELGNGEVLQADLVVLGVGVTPNTQMVKGADRLPDGSLKVTPFMELEGHPNVYAAGDIATFPYYKTGTDVRVEHWNVALQQGRTAAEHMMGRHRPYSAIPFFWSMILGKSIRYAGHCAEYDDVIIEGDVENLSFVAYYVKDQKILAVATCGKDPVAVTAMEMMQQNALPGALEYQLGYFNSNRLIQLAKTRIGKEYEA